MGRPRKIVIPGGSGHVGSLLARTFQAKGDEVVVFSREPRSAPWRTVAWDARSPGPWAEELEGADVVINLAGRTVNCRYDERHRREIKDSRVDSTRVLGAALARARRPPPIWLQASTATIYAHRLDAANDEATGILGGDEPGSPDTWRFSIDVARSWEQAAQEVALPGTRLVLLRSAMTMSPDPDGIFDTFLWLVRRGLGGASGDGSQFVSWIHEDDFVSSLEWLIEHPELEGPVNVSSPSPLPNVEFMRILREAAGMPLGLPSTRWMVEIGAFLLRTESELLLKSRRVVPARLQASGFTFRYPEWTGASRDLVARWRARA